MPEAKAKHQLLLLAEPLLREGLIRLLERDHRLATDASAVEGSIQIVIWSVASSIPPESVERELQGLKERWQPAPLLLVLGEGHGLAAADLLLLASEGLLETPDASQLVAALDTLLGGGRVVELKPACQPELAEGQGGAPTLGQALLLSGLQQLDIASSGCRLLLSRRDLHPLARLMLEGRLREMALARRFLLWLWGPLSLAWSEPIGTGQWPASSAPASSEVPGSSSLTLQQRNASGVWQAVQPASAKSVAPRRIAARPGSSSPARCAGTARTRQ